MQNEIKKRLAELDKIFDLKSIQKRQTSDPTSITKYYRLNRLTYWLLMDRGGSVHLSLDGDYLGSAKLIAKLIDKYRPKTILELAAGKGANTKYLSKEFQKSQFFALDLPKGQFNPAKLNQSMNVDADDGDFHNLEGFTDATLDLVFIVEALCYANNQNRVIREVKRTLRPGGLFVIIQDNLTQDNYSSAELLAVKLLHAGVMSNFRERSYRSLKTNLTKNGMKIIQHKDLTENVQPQLERFDNQARFFIRHERFTRLLTKLLPQEITANIISVYLLPALFRAKLDKYEMVIAQKIKS